MAKKPTSYNIIEYKILFKVNKLSKQAWSSYLFRTIKVDRSYAPAVGFFEQCLYIWPNLVSFFTVVIDRSAQPPSSHKSDTDQPRVELKINRGQSMTGDWVPPTPTYQTLQGIRTDSTENN